MRKSSTGGTSGGVTCVVADDHPAVLDSVSRFLEQHGLEVLGRARDGEDALAKIESQRPRIAILDARMPRLGGVEVARRATRSAPETSVILYTGFGERALLNESLDAGVRGFVLKEAPLPDLVRAVEMVADGRPYVDPVLAGILASQAAARVPELTQRERETLRLLAEGLSNDEVGRRLFIAPETVRAHVRKAMAKLGANTRTQAVAMALRQSLIG